MDVGAAGSARVEQCGVDGCDFVADLPGGFGGLDGKAAAAKDRVVRDAVAAGFAGSTRGVGAGKDAAIHAVAAGYFFCEVPGGCAAAHHDFVEDVEGVVFSDGADAGHWIDVEVHP